VYCLDELDRKKVKYPHLTDLAAGKIGRQGAAGTLASHFVEITNYENFALTTIYLLLSNTVPIGYHGYLAQYCIAHSTVEEGNTEPGG
jgi:hypothetical protein